MEQLIYFNKIYIIESLCQSDQKTGSNLYNDLIRYRVDQIDNFSAELIIVTDKAGLLNAFDHILNEASPNSLRPYLHFEIHGDKKGFQLENGDKISWKDLYQSFSKINQVLQNQLFISLATCYGGYLFSIIDPTQRSPFFGYVGNTSEITNENIEVGFYEYFETLLSKFNLDTAVKALNQANPGLPYIFLLSSTIFDEVSAKLKSQMKNRKHILAKRKQLEKEARHNPKIRLKYTKTAIKDEIRNIVRNYPRNMDIFKAYFLFEI